MTLYLNGGNQDLQCAAIGFVVYQRAKEADMERQLLTERVLQDIRD